MAIKKSQLYASLWQSCDELRGGMDASQYKDYILTLLFMKYVSDKAANDPYSLIEVPEGGSFNDMVKLIGDKEIGDKINKIIGSLAEANDLKGVIDQADFNDDSKLGKGQEMQDRLSKLVAIFNNLDLSANRAEGDDLLGDAYEYLMQHFATESGKSKGQFYTPAEVSRIMAQVIGIGPNTQQHQTIYDPTCGSGSLLLRAADEAPDGIPDTDINALGNYWTVFPTLRDTLFKSNGRPGYSDPRVETQHVKTTILNHDEFTAYQQQVDAVFEDWRETHESSLIGIDIGALPRKIIHTLSEDLLERFGCLPLLERYDVYQKLMDYWDEVMQDDVYLIAAEGWVKASKPRGIIEDKQKKIKETADLVVKRKKYKMDLIPPMLIVARYFAAEQEVIEMLEAKQETAVSALEEYIEEHTGEDGLLADALNDKGNITASSVKARLKAITPDLTSFHETQDDNDDERDTLDHCQSLLEAKSKAEKAVKDAQLALDEQVLAHYATLTEAEIKTLVVEDKWVASIRSAIEGEVQRVIQALTERVKELEERYDQPLPTLMHNVQEFSLKVDKHLSNMGVDWRE